MSRAELVAAHHAAHAAWRHHLELCGDCQPDTGPDTYCTDGHELYQEYAAIQDKYLTDANG